MDGNSIACYPFQGTTETVVYFDRTVNEIVIYNNGSGDLTFSAGTKHGDQFTYKLKSGDMFDESLGRISYIKILPTNGEYSGYARRREN